MTGRLKIMWAARTAREQWLLAILGLLVAVVLAWLLVVRPLGAMSASARERHAASVAALAQVRTDAALVRALERRGGQPVAGPLDAAVARAASAAGFQLTALEAMGPDRIRLSIASARPQALFGWLAGLERGGGLIVERLETLPNSDRTLAAKLVLRARGT